MKNFSLREIYNNNNNNNKTKSENTIISLVR